MRQGTSLAAAHVTGAIALLLQANPLLTPEEVAALLRNTAQRDEYTAAHMGAATPWSEPWGAGKLQVLTAAQTVIATTPTITPTPYDHSHAYQHPHPFTHRDCNQHRHRNQHSHGHCYHHDQACSGLTTCTAHR